MLRSVLLCACLALAACQAPNPYVATSLPEAHVYDAGAYPAAPRDYGAYRTWRWEQEPASGDYRTSPLHDAVAAGLERLGLRPSRDAQADLTVRAGLHQAQRLEQYVEPYGYYGYLNHYNTWAMAPRVYSYRREVVVVDIELLDSVDGQAVWRGQGESPADTHRDRLYQAVREALSGFPP